MNNPDFLPALSRRYRLDLVRLLPDIPLAGSPERSSWRGVAATDDGRRFVLEKIPSRWYARKRRIAQTLANLFDGGLRQIAPYRPDVDGDFLTLVDHGLWQLCPYVGGVLLDRPAYVMEGWRGEAVAAFLIQFQAVCSRDPRAFNTPTFSICAYIHDLFAVLSRHNPQVALRYRPFVDHLNGHLAAVHDRLPTRFCHGDLHPINIVWGNRSIRAVIDWEFCGSKPEIFDLANLLGCLGVEDPQSLSGPFVQRLIDRLKRAGLFSEKSWAALPDLMLAIRFAWLSEWLRKKDRDMIQLEADYMALLLSHGPGLF